MNEIGPALTPEEWEKEGARAISDRDDYMRFRNCLDALTEYDSTSFRTRTEMRKAVAAHALHGQPFGFTWDMVHALRECVATADFPDRPDLAEAAIERIASLLPPEKP